MQKKKKKDDSDDRWEKIRWKTLGYEGRNAFIRHIYITVQSDSSNYIFQHVRKCHSTLTIKAQLELKYLKKNPHQYSKIISYYYNESKCDCKKKKKKVCCMD